MDPSPRNGALENLAVALSLQVLTDVTSFSTP
jgi:hypothetical protein